MPHFSRSLREVGLLTYSSFQARPTSIRHRHGQQKEIEKLNYMHRNPVMRGLVARPEDWQWSSYRSYAYGEEELVRINDWTWWEEKIRRSAG